MVKSWKNEVHGLKFVNFQSVDSVMENLKFNNLKRKLESWSKKSTSISDFVGRHCGIIVSNYRENTYFIFDDLSLVGFFVAETKNRGAGYKLFYGNDVKGENPFTLKYLAIAPSKQHKGYGTKIISCIEENLEFFGGNLENDSLCALVSVFNAPSKCLLSKNGYERLDLKNFSDEIDDPCCLFCKPISKEKILE